MEMSLQAGRDLNCSLAEQKRLMRELTEQRKLLSDIYHLLPESPRAGCGTKIAKDALRSHLVERGLI